MDIDEKKLIDDITVEEPKKQERRKRGKREEQNIIEGGGGVYGKLVLEPVGGNRYVYNYAGKRGLATASYDKETGIHYIEIEGERFLFERDSPPLRSTLFRTPSEQSIQEYVEGDYEVKEPQDIYEDIVNYLKLLYDVEPGFYYHLVAIGVLQSWVLPLLQAVFYLYFVAKYGGGKTVFLEGLSAIARHGFMAGNISSAALARSVHKYSLTVFADEFDARTKSKDNDLYRTFRQGHRRNNPYIRCKETRDGYTEETFDVFGPKACSVHGEIESALQSRGIDVPLRTSKDHTLPILNLYKEKLGQPVLENLFFWRLENLADLVSHVSAVTLFPRGFGGVEKDISQMREEIFRKIADHFSLSEREITALRKFFGRNEELLFIALQVCKAFDIDKTEVLENAFVDKTQKDEVYSDNFLVQLLREQLTETYKNHHNKDKYILTRGAFAETFYFPMMEIYKEYRMRLQDEDIRPVSTSTFKDFLQELDFNEGINIKKERVGDRNLKCLIYDDVARKTLSLDEGDLTPDQEEVVEALKEIIWEEQNNNDDRLAEHQIVLTKMAETHGVDREKAEMYIDKLKETGDVSEPQVGFYRMVKLT